MAHEIPDYVITKAAEALKKHVFKMDVPGRHESAYNIAKEAITNSVDLITGLGGKIIWPS